MQNLGVAGGGRFGPPSRKTDAGASQSRDPSLPTPVIVTPADQICKVNDLDRGRASGGVFPSFSVYTKSPMSVGRQPPFRFDHP